MASHRNSRLKIYGDAAEVEKLINNRYRVIVRCLPFNKIEDWYADNVGMTFGAFASAMDDEILIDGESKGWTPRDGQAYANAQLISMEFKYLPNGTYVAEFIYETLTSTWTASEGDVIGSTDTGLRTLVRTQVAKAGTAIPYDESDVGVETITSGGVTLYLSGIENQSDERMGNVVTRWAQPGILSKDVGVAEDGVRVVRWRFFHSTAETGIVGPVLRRGTENWEGFQVIVVDSVETVDGSDIVNGENDRLVSALMVEMPWTRPGVAAIREFDVGTDLGGANGQARGVQLYQQNGPVQLNLRVWRQVWISKNEDWDDADFTSKAQATDATVTIAGYWNPYDWAKLRALVSDSIDGLNISDINELLRGYRVITSSDPDYSATGDTIKSSGEVVHGQYLLAWQNGSFFGRYTNLSNSNGGDTVATATISGGPPRPEGSYWMFKVYNDEDFTDEDGTRYYKRVYLWGYVPDFEGGEDIFDG